MSTIAPPLSHSDCDSLLEVSKVLLIKSGLINWSCQDLEFAPSHPNGDDSEFEEHWKKEFHPKFGRYMAWVLFSVGAENLVKAACVCNRIVEGPWYGTLERYTRRNGLLHDLCEKVIIRNCDETKLTEGYKSLKEVRNRDVHGYVANERRGDFPAIEPIFVPAFNILVMAMNKNRHFEYRPPILDSSSERY